MIFWLALISGSCAFDICTVQPKLSEISEVSAYELTLLDFSSPVYSQGSKFKLKFPSEVPLTSTSSLSVCQRMDMYGGLHNLNNCNIETSSTVSFELDAEVNTAIYPVKCLIGNAINPNRVMRTSTFEVYYYQGTTLTDSRTSNVLPTYTPGSLTGQALTTTSLKVYESNVYTFKFSPSHTVLQGALINLNFPTADFALADTAYLSIRGKVDSAAWSTLSFERVSTNEINVKDLFVDSALIATPTKVIFIEVTTVKNPDSRRTSSSVRVSTMSSNKETIDQATTGFTVTPTTAASISEIVIVPIPSTVLRNALYSIKMSPDISIPTGGSITVDVPSTVELGSVTCDFPAGFIGSGYCTVSGRVVTAKGVSFTKSTDNMLAILTISGLKNPPDTYITDYFKFATYDSGSNLMCQNLTGARVSATPGALTVQTSSRRSDKVQADGPYTLKFTTVTKIPEGAMIVIMLPKDQVTKTASIECKIISGGVTLGTNICSFTESSSQLTLTAKEWCSTNTSGCPANTTFELSLQNVQNPSFIDPSVASSVKVYLTNPSQTGYVDIIETGVSFTPTLSTMTLTDATVVRLGNVVASATELIFAFTPTVALASDSVIVFYIPDGVVFPSDSSVPVQCFTVDSAYTNPSSKTCTASQYSSTAYSVLTVSGVCDCAKGAKVFIKVNQLKNPTSTKPISTSFTMRTNTNQGFYIEYGSIDASGIGAQVTNSLTELTLTRSSDAIQTQVSFVVSFRLATVLSNDSTIELAFPANLVVENSSLLCETSSGASLTCSKTSSGGSISKVLVSGYCSTQCSKGSVVSLRLKNTKTLDYVKDIPGSFSATTQLEGYSIDTATVSDVKTQVASLTPGALIDLSIVPANPSVSATTAYRLIFTPEHSIPAGAVIEVQFPSDVTASDRSSASNTCMSVLTISSSLQCSINQRLLSVSSGFDVALSGSWMIGFSISSIKNPGSVSTTGAFSVTVKTSTGYVIDMQSSYTLNVYDVLPSSSCDSKCLSCSGTSNSCYNCINPGSFPILRSNTCVAECLTGTFMLTNPYTCLKCHYTCSSCLSHLASECTACASGYVKSDGYCVRECPTSTTDVNGVCVRSTCSSECLSCSSSQSHCLSCSSSSSLPVLFSDRGQCKQQQTSSAQYCPAGYYTKDNKCERCFYECAECINASTYCLSCKALYDKPLLNKQDYTCVKSCPVGVTVQVGSECIPCHSSCSTCSGTTATSCLTCPSTSYKTADNQCVSTCPTGTYYTEVNGYKQCITACDPPNYVESATRNCKACESTCKSCNGPDASDCLTCSDTGATPYYTDVGTCVDNCSSTMFKYTEGGVKLCYTVCPTSTYYSDSNGTKQCISVCNPPNYVETSSRSCKPCDSTCKTCSGSTNSSCTSCDTTGINAFLTDSGSCVASCTTYRYTIGGVKLCYSVCPDGTFYSELQGYKECIASCPSPLYTEITTRSCKKCDASCMTCNGTTSSSCLTCNSAGSAPYFTDTGMCVGTCPANLYKYTFDGKKLCYTACPSPTYSNDSGTIKECTTTCATGNYIDTGNYCKPCNASCSTCTSATSCTECATDYTLKASGGLCYKVCPSGMYQYGLECKTTCPNGTYANRKSDGSMECVSACVTGMYGDSVTKSCKSCDVSCMNCRGSSANDCTSCYDGYYSYNSTCVSKCPDGTVVSGKVCKVPVICQAPCATCVEDSATRCTSCATTAPYLYLESCNIACPNSTFPLGSTCSACDLLCDACTSATSCTACKDSLYLQPDKTCASDCPSNYTANNSTATCDEIKVDPPTTNVVVKDDNSSSSLKQSTNIPVAILVALFFFSLLLVGFSKLTRPDSHQTYPAFMALVSAVEFAGRFAFLVVLWQYEGPEVALQVAVAAGVLLGGIVLSLMFQVLYFEPVCESSSNLEALIGENKHPFALLKRLSVLFGIHFHRIYYSGLFGLDILNNPKTIAAASAFRMPLEKLCILHVIAINAPSLLLQAAAVGVYPPVTDPFQVGLFGLILNIGLSAIYIADWRKSEWKT